MTQSELKKLLSYDPKTGLFIWLRPTSTRVKTGGIAGNANDGYIQIVINKKRYKGHRLAWLYMTGEWPRSGVKHINGMPEDNRFDNLKDGTANSHARFN